MEMHSKQCSFIFVLGTSSGQTVMAASAPSQSIHGQPSHAFMQQPERCPMCNQVLKPTAASHMSTSGVGPGVTPPTLMNASSPPQLLTTSRHSSTSSSSQQPQQQQQTSTNPNPLTASSSLSSSSSSISSSNRVQAALPPQAVQFPPPSAEPKKF